MSGLIRLFSIKEEFPEGHVSILQEHTKTEVGGVASWHFLTMYCIKPFAFSLKIWFTFLLMP